MTGKVSRSSGRRPKRSIVRMAGMAKTALTMPKPQDARSAWISLNPASVKMVAVWGKFGRRLQRAHGVDSRLWC